VKSNQAVFPLVAQCRVLGVSSSGYHAWRIREPSDRRKTDAALTERIRSIHERSWGTYRTPRVYAELSEQGVRVGRKRVARLMKEAGLRGVSRRKGVSTAVRSPQARPAPDLVEREFAASGPDRLLGGRHHVYRDLGGFSLSLRRCGLEPEGGWPGDGDPSAHTAGARRLEHGSLAASAARGHPSLRSGHAVHPLAFGQRCREAGVRPSTGSVGDAYDNALCESFFATLECELLDRRRFRTQAEARMAIFEFIEGFCNPQRRDSALGYLSPVNYERRKEVAV